MGFGKFGLMGFQVEFLDRQRVRFHRLRAFPPELRNHSRYAKYILPLVPVNIVALIPDGSDFDGFSHDCPHHLVR